MKNKTRAIYIGPEKRGIFNQDRILRYGMTGYASTDAQKFYVDGEPFGDCYWAVVPNELYHPKG